MSLLKSTQSKQPKIQLTCRIEKATYGDMKSYCKWVGMSTADFIMQSVEYIISRDKAYQQSLKNHEKSSTDFHNAE